MFTALFAISNDGVIGYPDAKALPWSKTAEGKADMERFRALTIKADAIIMGRNTWESLPPTKLPYRRCMVISKTLENQKGCEIYKTLEDCIVCVRAEDLRKVYFVGGLKLLESIKPFISKYDITIIPGSYNRPGALVSEFLRKKAEEKNELVDDGTFIIRDEEQILRYIAQVINESEARPDRTGVGSLQKFGGQMSFDLTNGKLPMITHRKAFLRGLFEELMWFIRGQTDVRILRDKNVHIWDGNTDAKALKKLDLQYEPHTYAGPIYGFQWRHFGGDYVEEEKDPGFDQLGFIINTIVNRDVKNYRRMFMSGWAPNQMKDMVLPTCHVSYQFHLDFENSNNLDHGPWLDCHLYQRSSDMPLALGWNVTSASLLVHLIAHVTGCRPRRLYHSLGNRHVYANHIEQAKQMIRLPTYEYPTVEINAITGTKPMGDLETIEWHDIKIKGYKHGPKINMPMNA